MKPWLAVRRLASRSRFEGRPPAAADGPTLALGAIVLAWLTGVVAILDTTERSPVVVTHWANGHMMDREDLFPAFANEFNTAGLETASGKPIQVRLYRANSGEIAGELKSRILHGNSLDRSKPNPTIVTPAADHWVTDVNHAIDREVLDLDAAQVVATTYIGIVTSREMARCLGWPEHEVGFDDIVELATDPQGWTRYACARPEWGREALLSFTYPARSSTARSMLFSLYAIAAAKPVEELTLADVGRPEVVQYIERFQASIDCYVPDTLDLNSKILSSPTCHFFFIAEDNLVKLYQGKVEVPVGDKRVPRSLDRDMVMIYPREGAIVHNHSAFVVSASFATPDQAEAARKWIQFLQAEPQQQAFMQEGFRRTTGSLCVDPLGSPFSPCSSSPKRFINPDRIDPAVAVAILERWE